MHGVHSPFVYKLVSEGFYNPKRIPTSKKEEKSLAILFKTIWFYKSFKMMVLGENAFEMTENIRNLADRTETQLWFFSPLVPVSGGLDLGFICEGNKKTVLENFERLLEDKNNQTVIAIPGIHNSTQMEAAWETIKQNPNVTVTIDTFHLGLVFFRKGQAKQHFVVRPDRSFFTDAILGIRNLWGLIA